MNNHEIDYEVNKIREFKISHPTLADALNIVNSGYHSVCQQRAMNNGKIPHHYKPVCGVISGPSGTGKTTFCNFVKAKLPKKEVKKDGLDKTIIPCVYVSIANMLTPKSVTGRILEEFGQSVPNQATEDRMLRQLKSLFATCETNLVLLDEIHEIVSGAGLNRVMSWLKSLVNETKASIFLAGIEDSEAIIDANPELKTRFKMRVRLHYMQFQLDKGSTEFGGYIKELLKDIKAALPFQSVCLLSNDELARLYLATDGNLENISSLMIEASRAALKKEQNTLGFDDIKDGFNTPGLFLPVRYNHSVSPFDLSADEVKKFVRLLGAA